MRETSLDEFVGEAGESTTDGEERDSTDGTAGEAAGDSPDDGSGAERAGETAVETPREADDDPDAGAPGDASVTPAVSTFAWTPDGAACGRCSGTVERRWRDDGELVCPACKTW